MTSYSIKVVTNSTIDVVAPDRIITTGNGLKAFQQTYYDYSSNFNVKDMDTVIIGEKTGIEYKLTYRTEPVDFANLPIIKKIIDSFQITDNASAS
jgi:predicted phage-related endonuclease